MARRKLAIITRYYPPDPSPAGEAACHVAAYLAGRIPDLAIDVVATHAPFGEASTLKPVGAVHRIPAHPRPRADLTRFLRSLEQGRRLVQQTIALRPDVVLVLTDPPLVNYWAGRLLPRAGLKWMYWSLDLYPEAIEAAGLAGRRNPVYRHLLRAVRTRAPDFLISLGRHQARYVLDGYADEPPHVELPFGIIDVRAPSPTPRWKEPGLLHLGYVGNLGAAHSADFLREVCRQADPARHRVVLRVHGRNAAVLLAEVAGNPAVRILDSIPTAELPHIDVHLVSLLPSWTHICVPSKAVTAVSLGCPIMFAGSRDSDTWQLLGRAGWLVEKKDDVAVTLGSLAADLDSRRRAAADLSGDLRAMKQRAFEGIATWLAAELPT